MLILNQPTRNNSNALLLPVTNFLARLLVDWKLARCVHLEDCKYAANIQSVGTYVTPCLRLLVIVIPDARNSSASYGADDSGVLWRIAVVCWES